MTFNLPSVLVALTIAAVTFLYRLRPNRLLSLPTNTKSVPKDKEPSLEQLQKSTQITITSAEREHA
ncbi:MAG: hypothetical protein VX737_03810 [Pseudomonadota bacterium]|nr:hypothetical protein [Pseudomonadota bacterium]